MTMRQMDKQPIVEAVAKLAQAKDRRRLAILRRSLARDPGEDWQAIGVIEPVLARLRDTPDSLRRNRCMYLVAGLMALFNQPSDVLTGVSLGAAMHRLHSRPGARMNPDAVERRLMQLVDADDQQLPTRLRSVMQLLRTADIAPDFNALLRDLFHWNDASRWVQRQWLRDYHWHKEDEAEPDANPDTESETDLTHHAA